MERETIAEISVDREVLRTAGWTEVVDAEFAECTFQGMDLSEAAVRNSRFVDCRFEQCDLSMWNPIDSLIGGCVFEDCRMLGIDWTRATWPPVALHDANVFVRCDLSMGTFADLDLGPVQIAQSRLREVSFRSTRMAGARIRESDCSGADFHGADLSNAVLIGARGMAVDPSTTRLEDATVDADLGIVILDSLGITLETS